MAEITCVLDACSIINLIHIDEDDFLLKKLKGIDFYLCEEVFKEVEGNVFSKLGKASDDGFSIKKRKYEIDETLKFYRRCQVSNDRITHEFKNDFFDHVNRISGYKKKNGEFYSACLALFVSRFKPVQSGSIITTKVFFHTDDAPARDAFRNFFINQQIGHIEDTADLLVLLYRLEDSDTFNEKDLERYLSSLFQEYALEVTLLKRKLKAIREGFSLAQRKKEDLVRNIQDLIYKLDNLDFKSISIHYEYFKRNKKHHSNLWDVVNSYRSVFDLESNTSDLLAKVKMLTKEIPNIYRL
ncbi:MAG: hypothetical protein RIC35_05475 [Marinoscillum sp.]